MYRRRWKKLNSNENEYLDHCGESGNVFTVKTILINAFKSINEPTSGPSCDECLALCIIDLVFHSECRLEYLTDSMFIDVFLSVAGQNYVTKNM